MILVQRVLKAILVIPETPVVLEVRVIQGMLEIQDLRDQLGRLVLQGLRVILELPEMRATQGLRELRETPEIPVLRVLPDQPAILVVKGTRVTRGQLEISGPPVVRETLVVRDRQGQQALRVRQGIPALLTLQLQVRLILLRLT